MLAGQQLTELLLMTHSGCDDLPAAILLFFFWIACLLMSQDNCWPKIPEKNKKAVRLKQN